MTSQIASLPIAASVGGAVTAVVVMGSVPKLS